MSKSCYLLAQHTVSELFTVVSVLVDDYFKVAEQQGRFGLPQFKQQKGSYSELMTITLVGDVLGKAAHHKGAPQGGDVPTKFQPTGPARLLNQADVTVARALLDESERSLTLGHKAYLGSGIYTLPKANALSPGAWTRLMDAARKTIEGVFSSLTRTKFLVFGQRNSFHSLRAYVCRKIAAHNFARVFAA